MYYSTKPDAHFFPKALSLFLFFHFNDKHKNTLTYDTKFKEKRNNYVVRPLHAALLGIFAYFLSYHFIGRKHSDLQNKTIQEKSN